MAKRSTWTRYPCCKLDFNPLWQVQDSLSHCYGIQHGVECACHSIEFSITQYLCSHVVPTAKCIAASGTESISPTRHVGGYLHPTDSHYLLLGISQHPGLPKVCRLP